MNKEQQDNKYQKELELLDFFDDMEYLHENFPKIMNKEQQDKLWNDLSQGMKEDTIDKYRFHSFHIKDLEKTFGTHNLNPEPQIKTWEDVEKEYGDEVYSQWGKLGADITASRPSEKVIDKCVATLKIAKLIELSYGGMMSEEEWEDIDIEKWCIIPCNKIDDIQRVVFYFHSDKRFIAFHTEQQAEEFMSHESNRQLVNQYFMM